MRVCIAFYCSLGTWKPRENGNPVNLILCFCFWCVVAINVLTSSIPYKYFIIYTFKHEIIINLYYHEQSEGEYKKVFNEFKKEVWHKREIRLIIIIIEMHCKSDILVRWLWPWRKIAEVNIDLTISNTAYKKTIILQSSRIYLISRWSFKLLLFEHIYIFILWNISPSVFLHFFYFTEMTSSNMTYLNTQKAALEVQNLNGINFTVYLIPKY